MGIKRGLDAKRGLAQITAVNSFNGNEQRIKTTCRSAIELKKLEITNLKSTESVLA